LRFGLPGVPASVGGGEAESAVDEVVPAALVVPSPEPPQPAKSAPAASSMTTAIPADQRRRLSSNRTIESM
jgi:hypothetical protein